MIFQVNRGFLVNRVAVALMLFGLMCSANAQTIKISTIAPEGSDWMNSMRAGAKEIDQRTDGRVKFKFYGGSVQGNDKQVLRKMRIGQLHGGSFTSNTLGSFHRDAKLYALPMMFNTLEEVQFVRERLDDKLRNLLEDTGYVNFGFAGGGFAHIMSNQPISNLEDMQNLKVWIPEGDSLSYAAIKALGVSPVTMPLTDVLTGLQTELIDTVMGPPAATIILQWNTGVSYITELPLAYIFAMLIIEKKYFDRIAAADQAIVREVMEKVYEGFDQQGNEDNKNAFKALLEDGMQAVVPELGQLEVWQQIVRESNYKLASEGVIDPVLLDEVECYISAHKAARPGDDCRL